MALLDKNKLRFMYAVLKFSISPIELFVMMSQIRVHKIDIFFNKHNILCFVKSIRIYCCAIYKAHFPLLSYDVLFLTSNDNLSEISENN